MNADDILQNVIYQSDIEDLFREYLTNKAFRRLLNRPDVLKYLSEKYEVMRPIGFRQFIKFYDEKYLSKICVINNSIWTCAHRAYRDSNYPLTIYFLTYQQPVSHDIYGAITVAVDHFLDVGSYISYLAYRLIESLIKYHQNGHPIIDPLIIEILNTGLLQAVHKDLLTVEKIIDLGANNLKEAAAISTLPDVTDYLLKKIFLQFTVNDQEKIYLDELYDEEKIYLDELYNDDIIY